MTKREVLTRILEEGRRVFEEGGSFTINGMLIANFDRTSELSFDYEGNTEMIRMVYVLSGGHVILCIVSDDIEKICVSDNWVMRSGNVNTACGRINGEFFSSDLGGNTYHFSRKEVK